MLLRVVVWGFCGVGKKFKVYAKCSPWDHFLYRNFNKFGNSVFPAIHFTVNLCDSNKDLN